MLATLASALAVANGAYSITYEGIEFPNGNISFADEVVNYDPGYGGVPPTDPNYLDPSESLGPPDYSPPYGSVSLGSGGRIVLQFLDNFLTGSDSSDDDLHIFEIGPAVESTFVDISKDGSNWESLGSVSGSTSSVDIDAFGFGISDQFSFVRLTDDPDEGGTTGATVGADIDAVGAIATVVNEDYEPEPNRVPETGSSVALLGLGLAGFAAWRRLNARC